MAEVLLRRFKHEEWPRPEMIMIDGGSPQISFLSRALKKENINLPLVGISKFGGDRLVFAAGTGKPLRDFAHDLNRLCLKYARKLIVSPTTGGREV